jgi:hypothetical protein
MGFASSRVFADDERRLAFFYHEIRAWSFWRFISENGNK